MEVSRLSVENPRWKEQDWTARPYAGSLNVVA
jgi:hypothetical protein